MSSTESNTARIIQLPPNTVSRRLESVKRIRFTVDKKLFQLMDGLSANVADALFEEMHHLSEEAALECHFNVMRAMRTESDVLELNFRQHLNRSWVNLAHRRDKLAVGDGPQDVAVLLRSYSNKHLNHYKILLEELRLRFCQLSRRNISFHPLLPGNFYLSFWHATQAIDLTYQERKLLLPLFHRFVMDRFGQVLSVANQTLIDLKVPYHFD